MSMRLTDLFRFTLLALGRQRFRSLMLLLSVGLGVAAVVILTALGEGARGYVLGEFAFLGKDTVIIFPGRKETTGGMPPVSGAAARAITLEEVNVLQRSVPGVADVAPLVVGELDIAQGASLPDMPLDQGAPVAVIGHKLKRELFDTRRAIGQWLRLRDYRFRVVGVLSSGGDSFGMDLSEAIFIPVASAQSVFNVHGVFRVMLRVSDNHDMDTVKEALRQRMQELHDGEQDVTIVSPDAMLSTLDDILKVLTLGVAGIAGISLIVSGILVMNVTLMSVKQRTAEIGLLKAVGAPAAQVRTLFLAEAGILATAGALLGIAFGALVVFSGRHIYPDVPFATPHWALWSALGLAVCTALLFAWLPAQQAANMEPVDALGKQ